jgi:hypothetical protein
MVPHRVNIAPDVRVVGVGCGDMHTIAWTVDGQVLSWGWHGKGSLGHGESQPANLVSGGSVLAIQYIPRRIAYFDGLRVVGGAAGAHHSLVWTVDGFVYSFGFYGNGCLGHSKALEALDSGDELIPRRIDSMVGTRVVGGACGYDHTLMVTSEGDVYSCGDGGDGQLGHGEGEGDELIPKRIQHTFEPTKPPTP